MAQIGQPALVQLSEGRYHTAIVAHVNSGDNVDLVLFSDSAEWENGAGSFNISYRYEGLDKGTGVGEWQDNPAGLGPTGPTGATGSTGATGPGALITSQGTRSYAFGDIVRPSTTNDVEVTISVSIALALVLLATSSGTLKLFSDANSNPTTEIVPCRVSNSSGGVAGLAATQIVTAKFRVKAGNYYKWTFTQDAGTATGAVVGGVVYEQILG